MRCFSFAFNISVSFTIFKTTIKNLSRSILPILSPRDLDSCWDLDADQRIFSLGFQLLNVVGSLALISEVVLQQDFPGDLNIDLEQRRVRTSIG